MKKNLFFAIAVVLIVGAALSGCMNRAEERVEASPTPNYMPQGATRQPVADPTSQAPYDWTRNAAQVEARLRQISEIQEARIVTTGNTALVGVKFDAAYRGEMTERIREMVAAEVMAADPNITTVAVTADDEDVKGVYEISDRMLAGNELDRLKEDINEIVRNATTLR